MKTSSMSSRLNAAMVSMTTAADRAAAQARRAYAAILSEVGRAFFPGAGPELKPVRVRRREQADRRRG